MKQYAVLLSHASESVYPELVCPESIRPSLREVMTWAERLRPTQQYAIVTRTAPGEPWCDGRGRTCLEIIRERWA